MQTITRQQFFSLPQTKSLGVFIHERRPLPFLPFFHAPRGWKFKIPTELAEERAKAAA